MSAAGAASIVAFFFMMVASAIPLVIGVALIMKSRGRGLGYPACGSCKYDVSASVGTSDRCPECGLLFINAGVLPPRGQRQPSLMWMGIMLVILTVGCAGAGMFSATLSQRAAVRARAAAAAASQQTPPVQPQQQPQDDSQSTDGGIETPPQSPATPSPDPVSE